jgi:hypothetical protein
MEPSGMPDAAALDLAPSPPSRLLNAFAGCPDAMFQQEQLTDNFDSLMVLNANWDWKNDGRFPPPMLSNGALAFGPDNLDPTQWWNNWTPLTSLVTYGDVLYCVHYLITPASGEPIGDNDFETSVRGDSDTSMALALQPDESVAILHTRTSTADTEHGRVALPFNLDVQQTVEVAMWAHGNHYYTEIKNLDSGQVAALSVDYSMVPTQGNVGMLGWRLKNALYVNRAVVGSPGTMASAILADK